MDLPSGLTCLLNWLEPLYIEVSLHVYTLFYLFWGCTGEGFTHLMCFIASSQRDITFVGEFYVNSLSSAHNDGVLFLVAGKGYI